MMSKRRIRSWYDYWKGEVYISFSGGKDSTALLHLVRELYPEVPAVFVDTGLEYPEIRDFVKTIDNVTWLKPKMPFNKVIEKYGYPVGSKEVAQKVAEIRNTKSKQLKNKRMYGDIKGNGKLPIKWRRLITASFSVSSTCCNIMKKSPIKKYEKQGRKGYVGTMAQDSRLRETSYLATECNNFESNRPLSMPLAFWTEKDIWNYLSVNQISYAPIYNKGYTRTGCMFCMFGVHLEDTPNRFQRMQKTHPKQWDYCINKLGCGEVLDYIGVPYVAYDMKQPEGIEQDLFRENNVQTT